MIGTLQKQLDNLRRLDRQLGAPTAHQEVLTKISQVTDLFTYSISTAVRVQLAALLSELQCLAGWQALDLGRIVDSWAFYGKAVKLSKLSGASPFIALASAGQAFVLADAGRITDAIEIMADTRMSADRTCSRLLRSWLAAAHGEVLAGCGDHANSMRAFDQANKLLPGAVANADDPYVALDSVHLARWRGHALARCGDVEAVSVLSRALADLDTTFVRAQTSLQVDLATALYMLDEQPAAAQQVGQARRLTEQIGSVRQRRRLVSLQVRR